MASWSGFHALPAPVPPTPPDFYLCHPFYGRNLVTLECEAAAHLLPAGRAPLLVVSPQISYRPNVVESGNCKITVQWMNPENETGNSNNFPTVTVDSIRQMASWLITSCVTLSALGGFSTIGLQNAIDWIADEAIPEATIRDGPMPIAATYFAVTIERTDQGSWMNTSMEDPAIAEALSDGVRRKGNSERADKLALIAETMPRSRTMGGTTVWWQGFSGSGSGDDSLSSEMVYTCDAQLGTPNAVDCSQLAYSGLGPPSDMVTVGPGSLTKMLSSGTCHVAVTALTTIALSWAQISAGLNTLVDSCVMHPLVGARGGRAFYGKSTGSRKRAVAVNGLDALPPGASITLCDISRCPKGI